MSSDYRHHHQPCIQSEAKDLVFSRYLDAAAPTKILYLVPNFVVDSTLADWSPRQIGCPIPSSAPLHRRFNRRSSSSSPLNTAAA